LLCILILLVSPSTLTTSRFLSSHPSSQTALNDLLVAHTTIEQQLATSQTNATASATAAITAETARDVAEKKQIEINVLYTNIEAKLLESRAAETAATLKAQICTDSLGELKVTAQQLQSSLDSSKAELSEGAERHKKEV
jgi:hypothetical protein